MRKIFVVILGVIFACSMLGCTSTGKKGAAIGGVTGAGLGAIIGHQSGETAAGAGIGAATGAVAGALIGEQLDTKFCPKCGRRFTSGHEYCPYDGTTLQAIEK